MRAKIWFVLAGLLIGLSIARNAQSGSGSGRDDGEFLIDTSITYMAPPCSQQDAAVAFDGTNYLVVWGDGRSGRYPGIYGARVSQDGTVLDPGGIAISTAANSRGYPAVAFDGTNYLVVWQDSRSGNYDIYGARVTPEGIVLDPEGIPISTAAGDQVSAAVAFDGTNFFVVWPDKRSGNWDIYGARVTPDGVVLDSEGISISTAAGRQWYPAVAFDGTNYLVVWQDDRSGNYDIYGARVTPDGVVLDSEWISISTAANDQGGAAVAFDGTNFFVVWSDTRSGGCDIYGARVSQDGAVLDTQGIAISTAADNQWSPAVAFDDTNFLVVWYDWRSGNFYSDIYGARLSQDGTVLDPQGIAISIAPSNQLCPAVAFDGTNFFVVWQDIRGSSTDIYGARVTPDGVVLDSEGISISSAANDQTNPAVAFGGTNLFAVWQDFRSGDACDIYGARVSQDGTVLDPQAIAISTAAGWQAYPAVAFDGTNYLVVWTDGRSVSYDIYGARVTPEGVVLDPQGIPISTAFLDQGIPAVAFDGTNYLVVWEDWRGGSFFPEIYGARVTPQGTVLDTSGIPISIAPNTQAYPAVAFDGTNFLVVWEDWRAGNYCSDIYGARVGQDGTVLDPQGIPISTAADSQVLPAVAFDGTNYLVVWEDGRSSSYPDIYGARVGQDGTVLDPQGIPISTAADSQVVPAVAFDGTNYLVVWQDRRSGYYDIYGAWVRPDGTVFDEGPVVQQDGDQWSPALCQGPRSQMFLAYRGWTGTVGGKTYNAYRIWGKMTPSTGVQEKAERAVRTRSCGPTVVRGVLMLKETGVKAELLDAAGRRVMELLPGANDVRGVAPGVYFICGGSGVHRVVVAR